MPEAPELGRTLLRCGMLLATSCACLLSGCASTSYIKTISDLPLKSTDLPGMSWQLSSMRANAQYNLFGANSYRERVARLGDYYYVLWYDAQPKSPTRLEMQYTQASSASRVLTRSFEFEKPRSFSGVRKSVFVFNGEERAKKGDILTWRINLYTDGKLVDSRRSYLWLDDEAYRPPKPEKPEETR